MAIYKRVSGKHYIPVGKGKFRIVKPGDTIECDPEFLGNALGLYKLIEESKEPIIEPIIEPMIESMIEQETYPKQLEVQEPENISNNIDEEVKKKRGRKKKFVRDQ